MKLHIFIGIILILSSAACSHRPSKVEQLRLAKAQQDSVQYAEAKQNLRYSDSLLQVLTPQVDSLLRPFVYSKDDKAEDHGHYVHRLLQTTTNDSRNFLQAYITDNHQASIQSYCFGSVPCHQQSVRISVGEDYIEKEGSNHSFESEGWHDILTITGEDALQLLLFLSSREKERIKITVIDSNHAMRYAYYLSENEKKALSDTYQVGATMRTIDMLERAIHVADLQIQKYEKKQFTPDKKAQSLHK